MDFLFEASALKRVGRTGLEILGVEKENVAEHSWHATIIGYVLSNLAQTKKKKVVMMLTFHDLPEVRMGDIHKLQGKYVERNEEKALEDQYQNLPFADDIKELFVEYRKNETMEAKIAHDADILSLLVLLKEKSDKGNKQADLWFQGNKDRLRTEEAKALAEVILTTDSQDWWNEVRTKLHSEYKKG